MYLCLLYCFEDLKKCYSVQMSHLRHYSIFILEPKHIFEGQIHTTMSHSCYLTRSHVFWIPNTDRDFCTFPTRRQSCWIAKDCVWCCHNFTQNSYLRVLKIKDDVMCWRVHSTYYSGLSLTRIWTKLYYCILCCDSILFIVTILLHKFQLCSTATICTTVWSLPQVSLPSINTELTPPLTLPTLSYQLPLWLPLISFLHPWVFLFSLLIGFVLLLFFLDSTY